MENRITTLFGIRYPIIAGGMIWCSGWRLASAVSNAGGLGLLGAGSMHPETLREHIRKCRQATDKPFGINVPLMYPQLDEVMQLIVDEGVKIVFTSAGNPKLWTGFLKSHGITVVHVVSSSKFARKCEEAGVDAIVAEGFEAGGHNGREETTTLCLIPAVRRVTSLPLIAAGGIATGAGMLAAMTLGAEGAQIGTRFAFAAESSAHENFKNRCLSLEEGDTILDLGCGSGRDSLAFYEQGFDVTPLDASEEMCKLAEIHTGLEVLNMAYEDMEFDEVFDGVWGNEALIHVPEDEIDSVMERVIEALCQGGILYLSFQEGDFEGIQNGRYFCQYTPVSYTHLTLPTIA